MTRRQASTPHLFTEIRQPNCDYFIVPVVSSERREYIPIGFNTKEIVANTNSLMIPTNDCSVFGIISSRMHFVWMKTVCGRLELRYAYSATVVYNTFPFPKISNSKRKEIEAAAEDVLMVRAGHPEKTLAELYNPDTMPTDLRNAHLKLDEIVDSCYMGYPFVNDEARLETLFKLYEKMTLK